MPADDPDDRLDLDAYLARIGYRGPREPTLEVLAAISAAHIEHIPFENLDVLLGRPIRLDLASLQAKLVRGGRGGYCFEQNALLLAALDALGFTARPISARVRWQRPRDFTPPRTHLFVRVELEESWLADVGVGTMSLARPLRLAEPGPQDTPHERRRIVREDGRLFHQAEVDGAWLDVCEFTLEEMPPIDREVANWFTSAHPESHFRHRLLVARALPGGGRVTLLDRELTFRRRGMAPERAAPDRITIESPAQLLDVLAAQFGLVFPPDTRFSWPVFDAA